MHSGNGPHGEMDRRAIECFDRALDDVGLAGPVLRLGHDKLDGLLPRERGESAK